MRRVFRSVINLLARDNRLRFIGVVIGAGIQVRQIVGEVAAGDLNANLVARKEDIAGRAPEIDRVFIDLVGLELCSACGH